MGGHFSGQSQLPRLPERIEIGRRRESRQNQHGHANRALIEKSERARQTKEPADARATARGPMRVAIAQGAPKMPKTIAPKLVLCFTAVSGASLSRGFLESPWRRNAVTGSRNPLSTTCSDIASGKSSACLT